MVIIKEIKTTRRDAYEFTSASRAVVKSSSGQWTADASLAVNEFIRFRLRSQRSAEKKYGFNCPGIMGGADEPVNSMASRVSATRRAAKCRGILKRKAGHVRGRESASSPGSGTRLSKERPVNGPRFVDRVCHLHTGARDARQNVSRFLGAERSNAGLRLNDGQPLQ